MSETDPPVEVTIESTSARAERDADRAVRQALADAGVEPRTTELTRVGEPPIEQRSVGGDIAGGVIWISLTIAGWVVPELRSRLVNALTDRLVELWRHSDNPPVDMPIFGPDGKPIKIVKLRRSDDVKDRFR